MSSALVRVPPGPRGLPFIGSVREVWADPLELCVRCFREHGDFVRVKLGPFEYNIVSNVEALRYVLIENPKNYVKSRNYRGMKLVLGEGLLTSEGEHWRKQRRLLQPAFHRERLATFASIMAGDTQAMLEEWGALGAGATLDVGAEMMRLALRIVGRTLFSTNLDDEASDVGAAAVAAMHGADAQAEAVIPLPLWVPTPANVRMRRAIRRLDQLVLRLIDERRRGVTRGDDLLDMLMNARDEETGEPMSDRQLRDEVLTLVLAGHETTAVALTYTFYLLARHPDVADRLRREAREVLGGRVPGVADVPRLELAERVVKESMRLYPPAWAFERQALGPDIVLGYPIRRGAMIAFSPYVMHRHPAHWREPETFDPERFTPSRSEGRHRYAYIPFGAGLRGCIGQAYAMMEMTIVVAMVAARFALELPAAYELELEATVTLRPVGGMPMILRPAG